MNVILHITTRQQWEEAEELGIYRGDTLDSDGFIHCSTVRQVVQVANTFFPGRSGLVLVCIDADRVAAEIRYEALESEESFPHIYGPLEVEAVSQVCDFEPGEDGTFSLPRQIASLI
jgi:uncharacterized protein (DUF952 family)